jgi:hypothetical protein
MVSDEQLEAINNVLKMCKKFPQYLHPQEVKAIEELLKERQEVRKHIANVLPVLTNITLGNHALKSTDELHRWIRIPDEGNLQYEKSREIYDKQQQLFDLLSQLEVKDRIGSEIEVLLAARAWWQAIQEVDK